MKKYLMTLAAVLCCAMSSMMFTACGSDSDDNNQPPVDDNSPVSQTWDINITQDISDPEVKNYLPIKVCFYDANGELKVEPMAGQAYNKKITYEKGATKGGFFAVRMIENFSQLEEGTLEFIVGIEVTGTVTNNYKNGKKEVVDLKNLVVGGYNPYKLGYDNIKSFYDKGRNYLNYYGIFFIGEDGKITMTSTMNQEVKDKLGLK
jgi:hypothetical protein